MITRLILALLLLAAAIPGGHATACERAVAASPATGHVMPHHAIPQRDREHHDQAAPHACLGCIAPASLRVGRLTPYLPTPAILPQPALSSFTKRAIAAPPLPPPRA